LNSKPVHKPLVEKDVRPGFDVKTYNPDLKSKGLDYKIDINHYKTEIKVEEAKMAISIEQP